jgi:hypothetical protein
MVSDRDVSLAHPEAFDFVFGNLPSLAAADFTQHLAICGHCQSIVTEYGDIGRIIQDLPPHAEPPAGLEDRTVAAILQSLTGESASRDQPPAAEDLTATKVYRLPQRPPPAAGAPAAASAQEGTATITPLALWRRHRGHLTSLWVGVAAAILILGVIVIFRPGRGGAPGLSVVTSLHATEAAKQHGLGKATGVATARQAGESWTYVLVVHGLKPLREPKFYECWYAKPGSNPGNPTLVSGGTFVVDKSGSTTLTMTSGVDPRQFSVMEITAGAPGSGAVSGLPLLTSQSTA